MSKITFEFACKDTCLKEMVPSDLREIVRERDDLVVKLDAAEKLNAAIRKNQEKMFPISTMDAYTEPYPTEIPWSVANYAYSAYANAFGKSQSMERLAERGGFAPGEMDRFCPGWIKLSSEIMELRNRVIDLTKEIVSRDQDIYVRDGKLAELAKQYDILAAAVGWTKEHCNKTGDGPVDVAMALAQAHGMMREDYYKCQAELKVAIRKIADLTK